MKKIITIILCVSICLFSAGCQTNKKKFDIGDKSDIQITEKEISLSLKEGTLTKKGATLVLKNDSDVDVQYRNPYEIEIKKDGEWHKINVQLNFTLPAFLLKAKETKELEINWEEGYGKLTSGVYRIIKSIDIEENGIYQSYHVAVEFEIK